MSFDDRKDMLFRLPPDDMRRLTKASEYRRQTKQAFVRDAVMAEVAAVEEHKRLQKQPIPDEDRGLIQSRKASNAGSPEFAGGLGISAAIRQQREVREAVPLASEPVSAPVVVNVGGGSTGAQLDEVGRLAAYVVNGDDFGRSTRLQTAVSVLHASASTDEERKVLAARLDEAVAMRSKQPVAADVGGEGLGRIARMAFDKLSGMLSD